MTPEQIAGTRRLARAWRPPGDDADESVREKTAAVYRAESRRVFAQR